MSCDNVLGRGARFASMVAVVNVMTVVAGAPAAMASPSVFDIALYAEAGCGSCNVVIPSGETRDIFIVADTDWPWGISAAELRVAGLPSEWTYVVTPGPATNVSIGDPMGPVGANVAFPIAMHGNCILLYRVAITATTAVSDVMLTIVARNPPGSPQYPCPRLIPSWCLSSASPEDAASACFVSYCVTGRPLWINSDQDCVVATAPVDWSAVKQTYSH